MITFDGDYVEQTMKAAFQVLQDIGEDEHYLHNRSVNEIEAASDAIGKALAMMYEIKSGIAAEMAGNLPSDPSDTQQDGTD